MPEVGTESAPLRVAIIGSGPSGFYSADGLLKQMQYHVEVDMFDRLPTPFGLVRGGVAPDHPKIKSVTKVYEKIAAHPRFAFFGNVEFGTDITHAEMKQHYHQIVYAVGAQTDRRLGIPGENLPGSFAATEFVAWYNAHPDYEHLQFDLSGERAAVVGTGNVAIDVARILASSYEELRQTDIADYALEALRRSNIREVYLLGRRGPLQAAYTNPELKELGELAEADVIVHPKEGVPDPASMEWLVANPDAGVTKNLQTMQTYLNRPPAGKPRQIIMRFLVSPIEFQGEGTVQAIKLVKNELVAGMDGSLRARATAEVEMLPTNIVFRSIGYTGVPLPDVPFDDKAGVIPNVAGRVIDLARKQPVPGEYAVGWIKRGPNGVIGTNRPDALETVTAMLEDVASMPALEPANALRGSVELLLRTRKPDHVNFADWLLLDQVELRNGQAIERPRLKFSKVPAMLAAIEQARADHQTAPPVQPPATHEPPPS